MEVSGQNLVKCDEEKALKCLLDAFGSVFSLEEIASAYCKASRNADLAGEILYGMQESHSGSSVTTLDSSNADVRTEGSSGSSSDGCFLENSFQERKTWRPKVRGVSAGTVSNIIGKDYVRPFPSANGSFGATKPIKLDAKSLPMTGIWREKSKLDVSGPKYDQLHQHMEDFLFKMLGDGFQLDRNMIRQVLDTCGYDMQKSLEKLLVRSNTASGKKTAVVGDSVGSFTDTKPKSEAPSSERKSQDLNSRGHGNIASKKGTELHQQQKQKDDLQKEVLSTLFNYHGHSEEEEAPKTIVKDLNKKSRYGHVVFVPPKEFEEELKIDMDISLDNIDDPEDEEDYQNVRRAVKQYRGAMNEYYKAAVDAFAKGDQIKAEKLLEQGQFFLRKAHEADEESNKIILETRSAEEQEMVLDLRDHGSTEAIRLLKCHLSSFSGIPSFEYLKVIVDANDEDNSKRSRRRLKEERKEEKQLQYLEFVQFATVQALMRCAILYSYAKERAGPLKPGVDTVEEAVKTVVAPVYDRFHQVPGELLKYADSKVAELDRHVPSNVKKVSSQARTVVSDVRRDGVSAYAKTVYSKYEPTAEQCAASAWRRLNQLPLFPHVANAVLPKAAYCTEKYNEAVVSSAEKGYRVSAYLPLVPTEKIAKVFSGN